MAKQSFQLDPNAATYSDDEIVGKVNSASAKVTADQVEDGSTNKAYTGTEQTKLSGVADNATIDQTGAEIKTAYEAETNAFTDTKDTKLTGIDDNAKIDQTGTEMQTAILALSDADRKLIKTDPQTSEFTVLAIQRDSTGKLDVDYDDVAV